MRVKEEVRLLHHRFRKDSYWVVTTELQVRRFQSYSLWDPVSNLTVSGDPKRRFRVDKTSIRLKKVAVTRVSVSVWTWP